MGRLAVVMVVRNEGTLAERGLRSVRDVVDDLVVLDLGSGPQTRDRLREAGARIVAGTPTPDRAALRNAALDAADADWNLVLDPGEWLDDGAGELSRFADTPPDHVGLAEIVRGPGGPLARSHPIAWSPRLLPRRVRYAGAVHEEIVTDLPSRPTDLVICSDAVDAASWRADHDRAEAVLLQALAVRPDDPYLLYQLGGHLRLAGREEEAADVYVAALGVVAEIAPWRHGLVVDALTTFTATKRFRDAVALMDAELPHWGHSPDFTFAIGDLFFAMLLQTPSLAAELVPIIDTSWRRCIELGDRPDLVGTVHGRGSFLAAQNLYVLALTLDDAEQAQTWLDRANELRLASTTAGRPRLLG